jgi:amino acid adenylation domain-containing protein
MKQDATVFSFPESEMQQSNFFKKIRRDYPSDKTVAQLFEECVSCYGDRIAVQSGDSGLTYNELNVRINALAHYLRQCGVGPKTVVALYLENSIELVIGILAIVKAGGAYLPLGVDDASNRTKIVLRDSNPAKVLTVGASYGFLANILPEIQDRIFKIDDFFNETKHHEDYNPVSLNASGDLLYVMYTSGSTGQPKGCMISHRSVVNLVKNPNPVQIHHTDVVAQIANPAFDAMTFEMWGALLNGARLCIIPRTLFLSPSDFSDALKHNNISIMFVTTALFNLVVKNRPNAFYGLKFLLFGGEGANIEIVKNFMKIKKTHCLSNLNVMHVYGPTECTTFSSGFCINNFTINDNVPIGMPLFNTNAYVLDETLGLVPPDTVGELYLGGDNLALGYLNDPEKTAEKFIQNPWDKTAKIYKTGDLVYWKPDVGIVFVGRVDRQVKIRGFRIELSEIEAAISKIPVISQVVVVVDENAEAEKTLVAYVSVQKNTEVDFFEFHQVLKEDLPHYMMPKKIILLDHIPLTPNGKIDKTALTNLQGRDILKMGVHSIPTSKIEATIAAVWQKILGIPNIDITRNLFDLGAHSLMLVEASSLLNTKLNGHVVNQVTVLDMLRYPTVRALAEHISKHDDNNSYNLEDVVNRANRQRQKIDVRK